MITATDMRKKGRESLKNRWGKGVAIIICYVLFVFFVAFIVANTESVILSIIETVISIPLSYGFVNSFLDLKRGKEIGAFDFINIGFSSFKKAWAISFRIFLKLILPIILFLVILLGLSLSIMVYSSAASTIGGTSVGISSSSAGILFFLVIATMCVGIFLLYSKSLYYVFAYNIAYDEPNLTSKEVVIKSKELMKGHRGDYFVLTMSFIGWALLASICTFGIGYLFLTPYMYVSYSCLYDTLVEKQYNQDNNEEKDLVKI